MGTLRAVTLFDVLPDAQQFLTWPALHLACASGCLFLWANGKYVCHVCLACAVNDLEQANLQLAQDRSDVDVALGLHCTMDGLGIALGLSFEEKRSMIKSVNSVVAEAYNNLPDFLILFLEYSQERVAINGNLNSDNQKHMAELSRSIEASSSSKAVYQ